MIKAILRTALLVVLILVAVHYAPALAPYETPLIILALITGLFGIITRTLVVLLLAVAAVAAYFFLIH
jgi:hypothetical protein